MHAKPFKISLESDLVFVLVSVAFKASLELGYTAYVSPLFAYAGFAFAPSLVAYLESWLIFFGLLIVCPRLLKKPSDFFSAYIVFLILTPTLVYFALSGQERNMLYYLLASYLTLELARCSPKLRIPSMRHATWVLVASLVGLASLVTIWMILSGGLSYFNLNILRVYEFRDDASAALNVGIMAYFVSWVAKVVGPALLALALFWGKPLLLIAAIGLQIFWFGITGHKSVLFYPLIPFFVWFFYRKSRALSLVAIGGLALVVLSLLLYLILDELFIASLLVRRLFFVPAQLNFAYYDFFTANGFLYWANSFASGFVEYPYDSSPAQVVGDYLGHGAFANNSFFSTGYMHAGLIGMLIYSAISGWVLSVVDSLCAIGFEKWLAISFVAGPLVAMLMSADLLTALLTHGLAPALVFLFLARAKIADTRDRLGIPPLQALGD